MAVDRYVTLGLARARTPWFSEVARWATSGSLAMEYLKTVSVDEVRARLRTGRRFSAILVDARVPGVDRDLLQLATERGCAAIVVTDDGRDWPGIGATATLPTGFDRADLEAVLVEHAVPFRPAEDVPGPAEPPVDQHGFRGRTVAVTGPGGVGSSTLAMAVAQGMAGNVAHAHTVVLADLCLHADQGLLHDARDVIPGLLELVEAHRSGVQAPEEVRALTFDVVDRRYRLLLGLRRHRDWTALRPRALRAAIDGLRRTFTLVVADVDADLEDEAATGSADVEDRNMLARATAEVADVVVAVGTPGVKGTHSLLRVLRDLLAAGIDPDRLVPVLNRCPRNRRARTESARAVTALLAASHPDVTILSPLLLSERRGLDDILRDDVPLPQSLVTPLCGAVTTRLESVPERAPSAAPAAEPVPVVPGSLGSWTDVPDQDIAG